ncbi:hypothetical protein KY285_001187 [Solanum tuberosum]|nr:hypothetical protein KY285_001187 [Solanum tuberosum]
MPSRPGRLGSKLPLAYLTPFLQLGEPSLFGSSSAQCGRRGGAVIYVITVFVGRCSGRALSFLCPIPSYQTRLTSYQPAKGCEAGPGTRNESISVHGSCWLRKSVNSCVCRTGNRVRTPMLPNTTKGALLSVTSFTRSVISFQLSTAFPPRFFSKREARGGGVLERTTHCCVAPTQGRAFGEEHCFEGEKAWLTNQSSKATGVLSSNDACGTYRLLHQLG